MPTVVKGKTKKLAMKRRKYLDADIERAVVVAAAIERVRERRC